MRILALTYPANGWLFIVFWSESVPDHILYFVWESKNMIQNRFDMKENLNLHLNYSCNSEDFKYSFNFDILIHSTWFAILRVKP